MLSERTSNADSSSSADIATVVPPGERLVDAPNLAAADPSPLHSDEWDYTEHARYYCARPNYSPVAIDELIRYVDFTDRGSARVADIGSGTGNLALMIAQRGFRPIAVEPNLAMMNIGMRATADMPVSWKLGTAENTGFQSQTQDWITFGSSFGTADRANTLREVSRIAKPGAFFTCMWNHRDLDNDPVQSHVERILKEHFPDYTHGVRREDQRPILEASRLFSNIGTIEDSFTTEMTMEQYKDGWRSVKNRFWNLKDPAGRRTLESILTEIERAVGNTPLHIPYTTRIWIARLRPS